MTAGPTGAGGGRRRRTAVITGGASGIGAACAMRFAQEGWTVVLLDVNRDAGESVAEHIRQRGASAHFHACDVADRKQLYAVAASIQDALGAPDILVTCAALIPDTESILDMDVDRHDRMWDINYHGTLHACIAFGRQMRAAGRGTIVTLGSINSFMPLPLPAYNPSKAALRRLTELLAVELGHHGIRVNSVAPTYVMTEGLQEKIAQGQRDLQSMMKVHALDALPDAKDVAEAVVFLCSDAASRITGVTLPVDGGWLAGVSYKTYAGGLPWTENDQGCPE